MAKGVHFLMKKNKITEIDGWGTFTDDHTISVEGPNGTETVTFDNLHHRRRRDDPAAAGHLAE